LKTKSKSTTICSHTNFTSEDICEIIKTCGDSGVITFECDGLRLSFQDRKEEVKNTTIPYSPGQVEAIPKILDEDSLIKQDEMNVKEDELAELRLRNPFEYETLLAERELEEV